MGVVPGDPRALTEIESHLAKSDPALAVKFAVFAADPSHARESMREPSAQPAVPTPSQRGAGKAGRLADRAGSPLHHVRHDGRPHRLIGSQMQPMGGATLTATG